VFALIACSTPGTQDQKPDSAIVCGVVTNPSSGEVLVDWLDTTFSATLDSSGFFKLSLPVTLEGFASFEHGEETAELFIRPGDSLYLTVRTDSFDESLRFSGKGSEANQYLITGFLLEEQIDIYPSNFLRDEAGFLQYEDSVHAFRIQLLDSFAPIWQDAALQQLMMVRAQVKHLQRKLDYPLYYRYLTNNWSYKPSAGYYQFLKDAPLEDTVFFQQYLYKHFLESVRNACMEATLPAGGGNAEASMQRAIWVIDSTFKVPSIRNYLLFNSFNTYFENEGPAAKANWLDTARSLLHDSLQIASLERIWKDWQALVPGKPAPAFAYPDLSGNIVSLESLRGKWLYIDVWATWCGPCLKELPALEQLQKTFRGKPITFVSISIDEDKEAWAAMVKKKEMGGIQLIADKDFKSAICASYRINGIPRFILIDPNGLLVDADAKRPSGAIQSQLSDLLARGV
jgi:thiol-disulfide isomerase/thioredoxin